MTFECSEAVLSQDERHHGEAYAGKSPPSLVTEESRAKSSQPLGQVGAGEPILRSPLRLSSFFTTCINSQACTTCPGELDCKVGRAQGGCSSEGCEVMDRSHYQR
jgi:hypothetical protein